MYHYAEGEVTRGPMPLEELRGRIGPNTLVWREGMPEWKLASEVPELGAILGVAIAPDDLAAARRDSAQPTVMPYADPRLARTTPGLAVAAMVLGIVSVPLLCAWFISLPCAVLALIFGLVARSQCVREERPGRGMALAGIILGLIPIGIVLLFVVIMLSMVIMGAAGH